MEILKTALSEKGYEENDYRDYLSIAIDGKEMFRFRDGEPEDASMGRDFSDVLSIVDAMELAYKAGKAGEKFVVTREEIDEL